MFKRLILCSNDTVRQQAKSAFHRLTIEAEKIPPVDPHSLEVLRDGVPRFLAPRCVEAAARPARPMAARRSINAAGPSWGVAFPWVAPQCSG